MREGSSALPKEAALVRGLMHARGITNAPIVPPPTPPDLGRAVERVWRAAKGKERIGIFGDYDCDGITAAAQMVRYFRRCNREPLVRLPHRVHDGYGLGLAIADEWIEKGISLLITVDTGITAIEAITKLQQAGIDVIVVDHHHVPEELPPAYALLHPALTPGFAHPHPSGAGMALLFLQALERGAWEDMHTDRALAMMGTVADLVELKGINRLIVQQGLRSLQDLRSGPLAALRDSVKTGQALTSTDIAFRIAPRLNAAGRMDDPTLALHALLEGGVHIAELNTLNQARRDITGNLVERARTDAKKRGTLLMASASADYPHGIIGLIAGTLTEETGCPSIVGAAHGDWITASLRSPHNYHVTEGLERVSHLLHAYGGHRQAAGCTVQQKHWEKLIASLEIDITSSLIRADLCPRIELDGEICLKDVSMQLADSLSQLEPFGQGNPEPRFLLRNTAISDLRRVGDEEKHLQMRVNGVKGIGFGLGALKTIPEEPLDLVCRIGINAWQGRREVQLFVDDLRISKAIPEQMHEELRMKN